MMKANVYGLIQFTITWLRLWPRYLKTTGNALCSSDGWANSTASQKPQYEHEWRIRWVTE